MREFFYDYNKGVEENIVVTQEFKDNITPPLERICIKRNWLFSDEYYVGSIIAEDLSTKIGLFIGYKQTAKQILNVCMTLAKQGKERAESKTSTADSSVDGQQHPDHTESQWKEPEA